MMHFSGSTQCLLTIILLLTSDTVTDGRKAYYHVVPQSNRSCSQDSCLTLPQFVTLSTSGNYSRTDISLFFLPGNHSLDRPLSLAHIRSFSMMKDAQEGERVVVECANHLARFNISEVANTSVQGLHFIGCTQNSVTRVERFSLLDTKFQGVEDRGRALILMEVGTATIVRSTFAHISDTSTGGVMYVIQSSFNIINSNFTNNRAALGGVLVAFNSSFLITNSVFTNNSAVSGGTFFIRECFFHIVESMFSGNNASQYGGVAITYKSLFHVTSNSFTNNVAVNDGGVIATFALCSFAIVNSTFIYNRATLNGGVIYASESSFSIITSRFMNNTAVAGGVLYAAPTSAFTINKSTFMNNIATKIGGVFTALLKTLFSITTSTFINNNAFNSGVIQASRNSSFTIDNSTFMNNSATKFGGVLGASDSPFTITSSNFTNNRAGNSSGVINAQSNSSFSINFSVFTNNSAYSGGVIATADSFFNVNNSIFTENHAIISGGVMTIGTSFFTVSNSTFTSNSASYGGGAITILLQTSSNITNCVFTDNSAVGNGIGGGVLLIVSSLLVNSSTKVTLVNSTFFNNSGYLYGVVVVWGSSIHIVNGKFNFNRGSFLVFSSNITFSGLTEFEDSIAVPNEIHLDNMDPGLHAGALTSFSSNILFIGVSHLSNNQAKFGGAISASVSRIMIYGVMTLSNNTATIGPAGGIYLQEKSVVEIKGNCTIYNNFADRGGGIYATSSTINIDVPGSLHFINNRAAAKGGGIYFETDPKLNLLKSPGNSDKLLTFTNNHAGVVGGAIFVNDFKNSALCSRSTECFIQVLGFNNLIQTNPRSVNIFFSGNTAADEYSSNLFGGIFDRCTSGLFAAVRIEDNQQYTGISYLKKISNITVDSITSLPLKLCFCTSEGQPNCQYQPSPIRVKRGETFKVPMVAIDQANRIIGTRINSSLTFPNGGFAEGQQTQNVYIDCTELIFNIFSLEDKEKITLYADGPCGSSELSVRYVDINFSNCTCSVGFEPADDSPTRCDCVCDSTLFPYITNCNYTTRSLLRETNSWIAYINDTEPSGFIISPNCPFDYCQPQTEQVNFSLPTEVDRQCAHNRINVLCGACKQNFSLSLGSSHCFSCPSHWPAVFVAILLASVIAGFLLVAGLALFNITVTTGLINGIIFYANVIAVMRSDLVFSTEPTFPIIFIAWLNLEIGFDCCFLNGLNTYTKVWLQLAFPAYIIALCVLVTKLCRYLPSFNNLIGSEKGDAILATLILLSYTKLLSVTVATLSFTVLHYPDGSSVMVWLPDGNVQYLQGKHIALVLVAVLIIVLIAPYTLIIFLWQWVTDEKIIKNTKTIKLVKWMKSTKLSNIVTKYHSPLSPKHHYWTGLLLLVRAVLYITAAVTNSGNPQLPLLMIIILIGGLFFLKSINGSRLYSSIVVDTVETVMLLNILTFSSFSLYRFNADNTKQIAIAYASTVTTLLILIGVVVYHIYLFISVKRMTARQNLVPVKDLDANSPQNEVTYSIVEISRPPSPLVIETNWEQTMNEDKDNDNEDCRSKSAPCESTVDLEDTDDSCPLLDESHKTI